MCMPEPRSPAPEPYVEFAVLAETLAPLGWEMSRIPAPLGGHIYTVRTPGGRYLTCWSLRHLRDAIDRCVTEQENPEIVRPYARRVIA
ncbi:hypothetical protein SAMN02745673_04990 [Marinactinospora thermotolerans DSM 45154]|uniref:Uncharacterized protein n=2 Tax=Marinactinospora thermotolerans TaxID=531310 RepID=A0A1T4TGD3_9ACTN|nr:hypothetical protein SAMN02745673_04990 [Marinactinospora thermotolerans DSM 45154]